jgi:hypothetical protein
MNLHSVRTKPFDINAGNAWRDSKQVNGNFFEPCILKYPLIDYCIRKGGDFENDFNKETSKNI